MSPTLATVAALLLYALALAPLLLMLRSRLGARAATGLYAAAFALLILAYTDFSPSAATGSLRARRAILGGEAREGCAEALSVTEEAGIVLDRSNPRRVVVNRTLWNQLPQDAKDVLIACLSSPASDEGSEEGAPAVEIVEQG